mmetsp:Transcript_26125/g.69721  ORF Transcript_26125/g.69721 Transcript_26125/m.69721 type:complete len:135 (+) Transcript_26125:3-407(+)
MNNKEKKKLQKAQAEAAKKKQKEYEARQKALKAAQKKRAAASRSRGAVSERKGPLSMLFSFKGLALTGITGFLYVSQRELLTSIIGLVLKYPILLGSWLGKTALSVVIKPILLRLISLKDGGSSASDVLPGGTY